MTNKSNEVSQAGSIKESRKIKSIENTVIYLDKKQELILEIKDGEFQISSPEPSYSKPSLPEPSLPEPSPSGPLLIRKL